MSVKSEAFGDSNVRRMVKDGAIVAFALKLTNDKWAVFDLDCNKRLTRQQFTTPQAAAKWCNDGLQAEVKS